MATSMYQMICETIANMPKHIKKSVTNVEPDDDSHDNGSIAWMQALLKIHMNGNVTRLSEDEYNKIMKRYTAHICYTYLKNSIGKNITYNVDLGSPFNTECNPNHFSVKKNTTKTFTVSDISRMNQNQGFAAPVGSYSIIKTKTPVTDENGNPITYWVNDAHRDDPNLEPFIRYQYVVDFDNPHVAGKFMNGGVSNYDIVKDKCMDSGMTEQEAEQHLQTVIHYNGNISVCDNIEEQEAIMNEIINMWNENPISNRMEEKYLSLEDNEFLYFVIQKIDNPLIVNCILSAQYVLDNHGTSPLVPALQKMYELMDSGIPEGVVSEKKHSDMCHPEVISRIDEFVNEFITNLMNRLDINKYQEITDEMINDVKDNCENALIRTFIGNTQKNITNIEEVKEIQHQNTHNNVDHNDVNTDFKCPITMDIMKDPVICSDGHSYERESITKWLLTHNTSPKTNAVLENPTLTPNHSLRALIQSYLESKK
tara:strand:- start:857 stop:2302 length:1446 start_codon:yes stop_codon:yes gene_type:complete